MRGNQNSVMIKISGNNEMILVKSDPLKLFLLKFHPKHNDKLHMKVRAYSGRKDLIDSLLFMTVSPRQRSKWELRYRRIHQEPIRTPLEAADVVVQSDSAGLHLPK